MSLANDSSIPPRKRGAVASSDPGTEHVPSLWPDQPIENNLLNALPHRNYLRILPALEPVQLVFGEMLHQQGEAIRHVYFPGSAMISLLAVAEGHPALEVGLIGREGMVGAPLALGNGEATVAALVQGSGSASRMTAVRFRQELLTNPALEKLLLRFTGVLMAQVSQTAACNRFHVVEQRLARWLLMSSDRLQLLEFRMTHEFLGHMLGVRRVGVTQAALELHHRQLINYRRGIITIVDRKGLERSACRCYDAVNGVYQRARLFRPRCPPEPAPKDSALK